MALSREEVEEIARAVARRVVPGFKPCRCGLAMWKAHGHSDSEAKRFDGILSPLRSMEAELTAIDEACSVNTARAKARLNDLKEAVQRSDWESAHRYLIELRVLTREPLEVATAEEEV